MIPSGPVALLRTLLRTVMAEILGQPRARVQGHGALRTTFGPGGRGT